MIVFWIWIGMLTLGLLIAAACWWSAIREPITGALGALPRIAGMIVTCVIGGLLAGSLLIGWAVHVHKRAHAAYPARGAMWRGHLSDFEAPPSPKR